jgi:hypothetical protein
VGEDQKRQAAEVLGRGAVAEAPAREDVVGGEVLRYSWWRQDHRLGNLRATVTIYIHTSGTRLTRGGSVG